MKRVALCILALLLSTLSTVAIVRYENTEDRDNEGADVIHIAEVRRMVTDKTEYEVGEPIMVTAWSYDLSDTVILMSVADKKALRKKYIGEVFGMSVASCGNGSGVPMDITQGDRPSGASSSAYVDLPAGEYIVMMQDKNNINRIAQVYITIK